MVVQGADSVSEIRPAGLRIRPNGKSYRIRRWCLLPGLAPPSELGVYNNNLYNGYRAFAERYFRCKIGDEFAPALPVEKNAFVEDEHLVEFLERVARDLSLSPVATPFEVVNAYTGPKRKVYARARDMYYRRGVGRWHAFLRSFVKFEKQHLGKAPRVINPRNVVYNLALGKFLKLNEKQYFKSMARVFGQEHVVIKGMDVDESARVLRDLWDEFADPVEVGGDAIKFDMHVSREALEYEHLFYLLPYHGGTVLDCLWDYRRVQVAATAKCPTDSGFEELAWLLSLQLDNVGSAWFEDGVLKFKMRGTRASGDLNTSLGNCTLMCALNYAWSKRAGVRTALGNNGDDCTNMMERRDLEKWLQGQEEFFAQKGFRMELETPVHQFEQVEFCQSKPVLVGSAYRMVRNPIALITKSSMCLHPVATLKVLRKWMMAVGVCEGKLAAGVPVIDAFARALRRNGKSCSTRLLRCVQRDTSRTVSREVGNNITMETRLSFMTAFGIQPRDQVFLEAYYDGWVMGKEFGGEVAGWEARHKSCVPFSPVTHLLCPLN